MAKALSVARIILLAISSITHLKAEPVTDDDSVRCGTLTVKSGCPCPGSSIVYQCAVNGSVEGLTVWQMSGCSGEISLNHDENFVNSSGTLGCPNVHGTGISRSSDCYVSELTIDNIREGDIGENVTCSLDVGSVMTVGRRTLSIPASDSLSLNPLRQVDSPRGKLSFTWKGLIVSDCPSLRYDIVATEGCGLCPNSRSASENFATCVNVQRGKSCTFSVFVNLCSDQIRSDAVTVSTGVLPTITNLRQHVDDSSEAVMLSWDVVNASYCSSIGYVVNATEGCGSCSASEANTATCRGVRRGIECTFFVFADVCGDQVRADTNVTLNTGSSGTPTRAVVGITLGVIAAAVVAVTALIIVAVAVWMYRCRGHHKCELHVPHCQDDEEMQEYYSPLETTSGSNDSPGTFGKYSSDHQVVVVGKRPVMDEATTIAVLLKNTSDEHVLEVSGALVSGSERIQCEVKETERNKKYELTFTPTMRGKHQLHIKVNNKHVENSPYSINVRPSVDKLGTHVRTICDRTVNEPGCLALNKKGEIMVVEGGKQCVSTFSPDGTNLHSFGSPELMGKQILSKPHGVAVQDNGTVLVTDSGKHCIAVFKVDGNCNPVTVGEYGSGKRQFKQPMGIAIHPITKHVYVTEYVNNRIQVLDHDLSFIGTFGSRGRKQGEFIQPWDVSFDSYGFIYVADSGNHRIQVFEYRIRNLPEPKWNFIRAIGKKGAKEGQLMWPSSVFIDRQNQNLMYITEDDNYRVSVFTHCGTFLKSFGKKGELPGEFDLPHGVVVDGNGDIYISDHKNNRIQVF